MTTRLQVVAIAGALVGVFLWGAPWVRASGKTDSPAMDKTPAVNVRTTTLTLDDGFRDLYKLDFQGARSAFDAYQKQQPTDPVGKAAEAASYLYEEFDKKGVFTSQFFLDDSRFLGGVEGDPAKNRNEAFLRANAAARSAARERLKSNPHDAQALLAITMTDGMESNYAELIEKKQLSALSLMRQAEAEANTLLAVDPSAHDADVALGVSNYVIGCLPGYKKMFLWFGGIHGDKDRGMQQLQSAAAEGHYLRPYAKIVLALALEREKQNARARVLLAQLSKEFPENRLFAHELALIDRKATQQN